MSSTSRGSARGQSSVELLAAFGVYLMVAALILESSQQLEIPARTTFSRQRTRLDRLRLATNLALADGLVLDIDLNRPYTFNRTQISTEGRFTSVNGVFLTDISCNTTLILVGGQGVNATCVAR